MTSVLLCIFAMSVPQSWKPVEGNIMTRWAREVNSRAPLAEYPRPTMVRKDWQSLNGLWEYAIVERGGEWRGPDGAILVPFPVESALSGVKKPVLPHQEVVYRRQFNVPSKWRGKRVLMHFDAVDWETRVMVNGQEAGTHRGGYGRFTFDVSDLLFDGTNEVIVRVWDPTDSGVQPRGKQVLNPEGIWYTAVTGIWQSVWIEPVSEAYIRSVRTVGDVDSERATVKLDVPGMLPTDSILTTVSLAGRRTIGGTHKATNELSLPVASPDLWSPESPTLFKLRLRLVRNRRVIDEVQTYFAFRKIEVRRDKFGKRIYLNNAPYFMAGPLDQGWWPDGLYTAPTDEALRYDLEVTKQMGFNMVRKHVKVEPERWYWMCDTMGLLVWQDMPSGDKYIGGDEPDIARSAESGTQHETELKEMIDQRSIHPSIVVWVPYNEGWGQWDTPRITDMVKTLDPTRLVDSASGWTDRGTGDLSDVHRYPGPATPKPDGIRAIVLGEFGGLGLPVQNHLWWDRRNWGYETYTNQAELMSAYEALFVRLDAMRDTGLSAAVYTQTTDVEGEVNGLMTYDREVLKIPPKWASRLHEALYAPARETVLLTPTAESAKVEWLYTFKQPSQGWYAEFFDDHEWEEGYGGFGQWTTPANVGTEWTSSDIWIRKTVHLDILPEQVVLRMWHDEDAEVYVNGVLAASVSGWVDGYVNVPLSRQARESLRVGPNTIAVHCKQTSGGQFIDVGLAQLVGR